MLFTTLNMLYSLISDSIINKQLGLKIRLYDGISSIPLHQLRKDKPLSFFWSVTRKAWRMGWVQRNRIHLSQIFSLVPDYQQHWAFSVNNTQVIAVWTGGRIWENRAKFSFFFFLLLLCWHPDFFFWGGMLVSYTYAAL